MCVLYRSLYYYESEAGAGCAGQPTINIYLPSKTKMWESTKFGST